MVDKLTKEKNVEVTETMSTMTMNITMSLLFGNQQTPTIGSNQQFVHSKILKIF